MAEKQKQVLEWVILGAVIALVLVVMLILFGNLSGNLGFASGTAGYNNTQAVIGNYTQAAVNTASQLPTVGTITGIAFLLLILIGVIVFAVKRLSSVSSGGKGGFGE